ncbi:hypothetical protein [Streptomyces griseus]|uniref:hypothetical protein n=1 Tax=Streptomyces griseus TaxID=1911 RepID=UPI00055B4693|nr:hypothetical protein [Streptomyces griseus]
MSGTSGIRPDAALEILCALTATAELRAGSSATKDILAEAVTWAYTKAGRRVRYGDDWRTHHVFGRRGALRHPHDPRRRHPLVELPHQHRTDRT